MTVSNSDAIEKQDSQDPSTEEPADSEAALQRLTDFVKRFAGGRTKAETVQSLKTQKAISIYEKKLEATELQEKGLQLDKAA